jgi:hypothetical protein
VRESLGDPLAALERQDAASRRDALAKKANDQYEERASAASGLSAERGMMPLQLRFPLPVPIAPGRCGWR